MLIWVLTFSTYFLHTDNLYTEMYSWIHVYFHKHKRQTETIDFIKHTAYQYKLCFHYV